MIQGLHDRESSKTDISSRGKHRPVKSTSDLAKSVIATATLAKSVVSRTTSTASGCHKRCYGNAAFANQVGTFEPESENHSPWSSSSVSSPPTRPVSPSYSEMLLEQMAISLEALGNQNRASEKIHADDVEGEWIFLALLLDRAFLIIFLLTIFITGVVILWVRL